MRIEFMLFEITLLLTVFIFLFWAAFAIIAKYNLIIQSIYSLGFVVYTGLYVLHKKGVGFTKLSTTYYITAFALLGIAWLPSGGVTGAILYFVILLYISGLLVLPLRAYILFVSAIAVMVLGFTIYEYLFPQASNQYPDKLSQIRDLSLTSVITIATLGIALYIFKKSYISDREKLSKAVLDLKSEKIRAEAADDTKSQFLATISHEMRTPLNGIVGITELLEETNLSDEQRELVTNLAYSSNMLNSLIGDVLDYTLLEDRKLVLQNNEIHIQKELKNLVDMFKPKIDSKNKRIELKFEYDSEIPEIVIGDVTRLRQILVNLVNNAVKFTNEGYIHIKTRFIAEEEDIQRVRFTIEDSGIGISEQDKALLFTKFFRAKTNDKVEGTGLGLAICRGLIDLMNGAIYVDSKLGEGSTFTIEIPFRAYEDKSVQEVKDHKDKECFAGLKILIAEDVLVNQLVLKKMLEHLSVTDVEIVDNGEDAVERAISDNYDFVLMDIQMPKLDGMDASEKITEYYADKEHKPKIIAVTANVMKSDLARYAEVGIIDAATKPLNTQMIRDLLSKYRDVQV